MVGRASRTRPGEGLHCHDDTQAEKEARRQGGIYLEGCSGYLEFSQHTLSLPPPPPTPVKVSKTDLLTSFINRLHFFFEPASNLSFLNLQLIQWYTSDEVQLLMKFISA